MSKTSNAPILLVKDIDFIHHNGDGDLCYMGKRIVEKMVMDLNGNMMMVEGYIYRVHAKAFREMHIADGLLYFGKICLGHGTAIDTEGNVISTDDLPANIADKLALSNARINVSAIGEGVNCEGATFSGINVKGVSFTYN